MTSEAIAKELIESWKRGYIDGLKATVVALTFIKDEGIETIDIDRLLVVIYSEISERETQVGRNATSHTKPTAS